MHLPPILSNHAGPWYASLSCSHLNMALRSISNGIPSPLCDLRTLLEQKSLKNAVEHGHKWWILPETCPPETQVDIITWAKNLVSKHPGISFAAAAKLEPDEEPDKKEDPEDSQPVDLRTLKATPSAPSEPDAPASFKRGDAVTVTSRMSWSVPLPENPEYRKDIKEGQEGVIEGFADEHGKKVLLKLTLKMPSGTCEERTQAVLPKNLQLTSEYQASKASEVPDTEPASKKPGSGSSKDHDNTSQVPKWLLSPQEDPANVYMESKWTSLLADGDKLLQTMCLKSRFFAALHAMHEALPKYTLKDFVVLSRKNDRGAWRGEFWTKRDFDAYEILLAPHSSQLKDTNLTASAHAVVTLPRNGKGAHPDNQSLALDGRTRSLIAASGSLDDLEHTGSLYWLVTRTPEVASANLQEELLTFEQHLKLHIPGHVNVSYKLFIYTPLLRCDRCLLVPCRGPAGKKRKLDPVDFEPAETPALPILINSKSISKHTKLCVFLSDRK